MGRGLGSKWWSIEGRGVQPSKAHWPFPGGGEINNLGSDDGAPECLVSDRAPRRGACRTLFAPFLLLCLCFFSFFPFPFSYQLPVRQARLASVSRPPFLTVFILHKMCW